MEAKAVSVWTEIKLISSLSLSPSLFLFSPHKYDFNTDPV
jgi:hypothetical protein